MKKRSLLTGAPFLPPIEEVIPHIEKIWDSGQLTNGGLYEQKFENTLREHLGVQHVSIVNNATTGLVIALKALQISGEVITSGFSFAATGQAIALAGLEPIFVDIGSQDCNIAPDEIKKNINEKTSAILAVHSYGFPCDIESIEKIAEEYSLKVIYDAAHALGVECHCGSILNHGDFSVVSLHATKILNTLEGGFLVCKSGAQKATVDRIKNFGLDQHNMQAGLGFGLNGKLNELSCAIGFVSIQHLDSVINKRKLLFDLYNQHISQISGIQVLQSKKILKNNYAYLPILIDSRFGQNRDELIDFLRSKQIYIRAYFHPTLPNLFNQEHQNSKANERFPNASVISEQVACLPLNPSMNTDDVLRVIAALKEAATK